MNAFDQADAIVQVCSGIFGLTAMVVLAYFVFFRKKKNKSS